MRSGSRALYAGALCSSVLLASCARREAPPAPGAPPPAASAPAAPRAALTDAAYRCELAGDAPPERLVPGQVVRLKVRLRNTSPETWPAYRPDSGDARAVNLAYHWAQGPGAPWLKEGDRATLPADLPPGGVAELDLPITAPAQGGVFELGIEPVYETVAWFSWKNGCTRTATVTVK